MEENSLTESELLEKGVSLFRQAIQDFPSLEPHTKKHFKTLCKKLKGWHYDGKLFDFDYGDPHGVNLILTLTFFDEKIQLSKDMELYEGGYLYGLCTIEDAQKRIEDMKNNKQ
jgi:hypothetical protein